MPKVRRARKRAIKSGKKRSSSDHDGIKKTSGSSADSSVPAVPIGARLGRTDFDMVRGLVGSLRALFEKKVAARPSDCANDAAWMEKYMRNQFKFFGIKAGERRMLLKEWTRAEGVSDLLKNKSNLIAFLKLAWEQEERDMQACGCDIAKDYRDVLLGDTDEEFEDGIQCVKEMITTKSWWDTVDILSYQVGGYMILQHPSLGSQVAERWITHDNMWLRRAAILHQLGWKEKTNKERLFHFCLMQCHEEDFFIRKAIGWALREYAKTKPAAVRNFVMSNSSSLSNLSRKEAMKHL